MVDNYDYDDIDFDRPPTKEQLERAKPEQDFLKHCGLPSAYEDTHNIRDMEDYIMTITHLCAVKGLHFDILYKEGKWAVRAYNPNVNSNQIATSLHVPVNKPEKINPRFCSAIKELAHQIYCIWGNGETQ